MIGHVLRSWAILSAVATNSILLVLALFATRRGRRLRSASTTDDRPVTLVRPFRGRDPAAPFKHQSLVRQRYAPLKIVFVCTSAGDPGLPDARGACSDAPHASCIVVGTDHEVPSDKARNMIAAWRSTQDPFVAFCDSDIALHSGALADCMSKFDDGSVGAVFAHCIIESEGFFGRLSMLTLTADAYAFLIGSARMGAVPFLQGGFMVLRRSAVDTSGGIEVTANAIGDDTRLGRRLKRHHFHLRLADFVLVHRTPAEPVAQWVNRYRRLLSCHRAEAPVGFWAELLSNPTVAPLVALPFFDSFRIGAALLVMSVATRIGVTAFVDYALLRRHGVRLGRWTWARPIADVVHMVMCLSVILCPWITWRGIRYFVKRSGDVVRLGVADVPRHEETNSLAPSLAEAAD